MAYWNDCGSVCCRFAPGCFSSCRTGLDLSVFRAALCRLLGAIPRARQEARLADLDRALLEEATNIEIAYGPSLQELVESLLEWGTPLSEAEGTVRLEVPLGRCRPCPGR